jgi:SnoaL-like domain
MVRLECTVRSMVLPAPAESHYQGELVMNEAEKLAERYVAVWNEADPQRRRETIAALWAPEGAHYVGTREVQGYDALEQRVTGSHEKNVRDGGHRFKVSAVHALQDAVMVDWNMVPSAGDAVVAAGRDVFIVDADHRILIDYQFIVG